jgi:hypothetical protein
MEKDLLGGWIQALQQINSAGMSMLCALDSTEVFMSRAFLRIPETTFSEELQARYSCTA